MARESQDTFDTLKDGLTVAPVVTLQRYEGIFVLDTDASDVAVGVILSKVHDERSGLTIVDCTLRPRSTTVHPG